MVSLQQAIARLGMAMITEIALAASLNSKLFKAPTYDGRIAEVWNHALRTALWGKEVARISKRNVEASFLCGLLHSIGRPVILQAIYEYSTENDVAISYDEVLILEQQFHVVFGEVIVQKWQMPIIVQESVQYYQNYDDAPNNRDQAMVISGAAKISTVVASEGDIAEVLEDPVFSDLNLYEDDIERLKQQEEHVKAGVEAMRS